PCAGGLPSSVRLSCSDRCVPECLCGCRGVHQETAGGSRHHLCRSNAEWVTDPFCQSNDPGRCGGQPWPHRDVGLDEIATTLWSDQPLALYEPLLLQL